MTSRIEKISIDEKALIRSDKNKKERERAVTDLLEGSSMQLPCGSKGPFILHFEVADNKFIMAIKNETGLLEEVAVSLHPLRRLIKDYHIICESYYDAVKVADPRKVEAIDMGRRGVHNEGSELLEELIAGRVKMDFETLRKLFSLIYVLQIK